MFKQHLKDSFGDYEVRIQYSDQTISDLISSLLQLSIPEDRVDTPFLQQLIALEFDGLRRFKPSIIVNHTCPNTIKLILLNKN